MTDLNRRDFLRRAGTAATLALLPRLRAAAAKRPLEVAASVYAWELHDEGVERVLDNLQQMAAVNAVYLVGVMHPEMRPFGGDTFPHNPVRKNWQAEDARCYWHPEWRRYGRVKPRLSDFAWLNETDWLHVLVSAARKRGLKVGVELSHALVDRERMAGELVDLAQRDVHGDVAKEAAIKWLRPPCPNHPATLEYALALAGDPVANHGVDFVQSCIMSFDPATPERGGGCFCPHCQREAQQAHIDLEAVRQRLLANPQDEAALGSWREFRAQSVVRFYGRLHEHLHALRANVDLRYNIHSRSYPYYGVDLTRLNAQVDSARLGDGTEQEGDPQRLPEKRTWIEKVQRELGPSFPLLATIAVRLKATPELVRAGTRLAIDSGVGGISLSHYDGARFPVLQAVGEVVREQR